MPLGNGHHIMLFSGRFWASNGESLGPYRTTTGREIFFLHVITRPAEAPLVRFVEKMNHVTLTIFTFRCGNEAEEAEEGDDDRGYNGNRWKK